MMVGSDCSFMRWRMRFANTAATRERSSARPVSFSTIEASVTSASGDLHRHLAVAPVPDLLQHAAVRLLHALDRLLARRAAREVVGVRQQRPLFGDFADIAGEEIDLGEPRDDLLGGEPLGDREGVLHDLAFDDRLDRLAQSQILAEPVLAEFEVLARLQHQHAADEHPRRFDHVLPGEQVGDIAQAEPARNVDDLLGFERAGRLELLPAERIDRARREADHEEDREDRIAGDDQRMARAARWAFRLRHVFGLQCGARAARSDPPRLSGTRRACVGHVHSRADKRRLSLNMAKG